MSIKPGNQVTLSSSEVASIREQIRALRVMLDELEYKLKPQPRTPQEPFNEEQGIGQRPPKVINSGRKPLSGK